MSGKPEIATLRDVLRVIDEYERKQPVVVTSNETVAETTRGIGLKTNVNPHVPEGKTYVLQPDLLDQPLDLTPFIEEQRAAVADLARWTVTPPLFHVWNPWDFVYIRPAFQPLDIAAERARLADLGRRIAATRARLIPPAPPEHQ